MARPILRELPPETWADALQENQRGGLVGFLGYTVETLQPGLAVATLPVRDELLLAPGELLHAGSVLSFSDSICGWGCLASLPDEAEGFTTMEVKANLLGTTGAGDSIRCEATLLHGGRTTQVWDAIVTR